MTKTDKSEIDFKVESGDKDKDDDDDDDDDGDDDTFPAISTQKSTIPIL